VNSRSSRFIQVPEDIFLRGAFRRLHRRWPEAVTWFLSILVVAKQCQCDERLETGEGPVTIEDVDVIPSLSPIEPEFVQQCCALGVLGVDSDGCLTIPNRKQWIQYPHESKEAKRKQAYRERAQGTDEGRTRDGQERTGTGPSGTVPPTEHNRTLHNRTEQNTTEQNRTEQNRSSSSGGGLEEGEGEEACSAGTASRPSAGVTFLGDASPSPPPNGLASVGAVLGNGSKPAESPEPKRGPMSEAVLKKFRSLRLTGRLERSEQMAIGRWMAETAQAGISGQAIQAAAFAAVDQAAFENQRQHLENPVGYARSLLEQHLENSVGRERANEALASLGKPGAEYRWSPDG